MEPCALEKLVRSAFADTPAPEGKITDTYDDEGAADYFQGRGWDGHDAKSLRAHEAAMCFFTPEAFRYYLPAFMLAELEAPEVADILGEYVVYQFGRPEPIWESEYSKRLALFTTTEKRAILAFIQYMQDKYGCFEEYLEYASPVLSS